MDKKNVIGFIGFGNMARAIAGGLKAAALGEKCELIAYNPTSAKITDFGGVRPCASAEEAARCADYLFICVKPQQLESAFEQLREGLRDKQVLISIVAGVSCERLRELAKRDVVIVRTMPDTPLLVGCGATAIARPDGISGADYDFVREIFRQSGEVYEIPGDKFDEVIPVAGSGVAVLFRLARLIADKAAASGLDRETSVKMFAKALEGAAAMLERSGKDALELETMVCSKGGTTLAMLDKLGEYDFNAAVGAAYDACVNRAKELGRNS